MTGEEKLQLAELRVKDELSTDVLLEACVDINSDACQVERQKAYDALKTYKYLTYLNPPENQLGYQEIQHLLEATSNSPEANQLRVIYDSYVTAYKSFGYDEEDVRVMAGGTMGTMIILHGVNGTFTIPKINKIFGNSKLLNVGKGTGGYLNKPEQGGTLNIGAGNKPIEGAYNISHPDYPMGKGVYPDNANDLSNIATGSQNKIIIDNPNGYRPINNEVIRVLNKDGVLIIRGGEGNKYIRNIEKIAADNGLKLVEKKQFQVRGIHNQMEALLRTQILMNISLRKNRLHNEI